MDRDELTTWRPRKSGEIVGSENRRQVGEVMQELRARKWGGPLAVVGRFGAGKTSCCRFLACCLCCPRFQELGEPCGKCEGCLSQTPAYNGDRHLYRHWEIDCSTIPSRDRLIQVCRRAAEEERAVLFFDEVPNLQKPAMLQPLLKFVEEFRGILLLAVTVDSDREPLEKKLPPPLCERLRQIRLSRPSEDEVAGFFRKVAATKEILASEADLRLLVRASERSFRKAFQVLAQAGRKGGLTPQVIGDTLHLAQGWQDEVEDM